MEYASPSGVVKLLIFSKTPPMEIILFSRTRSSRNAAEIEQLFNALHRFGFDYILNEEFAAEVRALTGRNIPPEKIYGATIGAHAAHAVMVCYGGDGTLLEGAHRLGGAPIPVLGINAGHLGFLTSAPTDGLDHLFGQIAAGELATQPRTMLEVKGDFPDTTHSHLALNEFAIQRHGADMIEVETCVNGQPVATYHGDGVIIATPTGSTAYSLSAGGPILAPACSCLVITPLAPHNLTMRPLVVPDTSCIGLRIRTRHSDAFVSLDNRSYPTASGASFRIHRAGQPIFLAVPHNISFYDTLRNKMMWGIDIWNKPAK